MEINADVCFNFLSLTDVLRYKHHFFSVNPDRMRIQLLAYLLYPTSQSRIDRLILLPVILFYLDVIERVLEVVHDWPDIVFVETQKLIQFLLCKVDGVAILFSQYFVGLLFLEISHYVFCDHYSDPDKVIVLT